VAADQVESGRQDTSDRVRRLQELSSANERLTDELDASEESRKESRSEIAALADEVTALTCTLAHEKEKATELHDSVELDFEELGRLYVVQTELTLWQDADAAVMG
jgi:predicted nuclease with TOPRIM domain